MQKMVKITKEDQEAFVMPTSVKVYERHGWTAEDDGSSEEAPAAAPAKKTTSKEG